MPNLKINIFILISIFTINIMGEGNCNKAINRIKKMEISQQQYYYGIMYQNGLCVKQNKKNAFKYFIRSYYNGYPLPIYELAEMYYYGEGVIQNYKKAYELYEKILTDKKIDSSVYVKLGDMYFYGNGVEKSFTKAKEFYYKAVKFNSLDALYSLGIMYAGGIGGDVNITKAKKYLQQVVNSKKEFDKMPIAKYYLAMLLKKKKAKNEKVIKLILESAVADYDKAQLAFGKILLDANKTSYAKEWIDKARKQGNMEAEAIWNKLYK